jgi:hypothetical protein
MMNLDLTVQPLKSGENVGISGKNKNGTKWLKRPDKGIEQARVRCERWVKRKTSIIVIEVFVGAGYGARTRGLNFGKVACYHYTKPAWFD